MNFIKVWYDWVPIRDLKQKFMNYAISIWIYITKISKQPLWKWRYDVQQCVRVTLKGTKYIKVHALIRQDGYEENITIGKICLFLCSVDTHVYVLVEIVKSYFIPYLRAYQLGSKIEYECLSLHNIMDFKPMHIYNLGNMLIVKPRNGFVTHHI